MNTDCLEKVLVEKASNTGPLGCPWPMDFTGRNSGNKGCRVASEMTSKTWDGDLRRAEAWRVLLGVVPGGSVAWGHGRGKLVWRWVKETTVTERSQNQLQGLQSLVVPAFTVTPNWPMAFLVRAVPEMTLSTQKVSNYFPGLLFKG